MKESEEDIAVLLDRVRLGDETAVKELLDMYKPLISANVIEYSSLLEEDDIRQLCSIGVYEAAIAYSKERCDGNVTFGLFAKICVRNRLTSELRRIKPTHDSVDEDPVDNDDASPEALFIRKEEYAVAMKSAQRRLTAYERQVLRYYLSGDSYAEISDKIGKSVKSVDNALKRIREKFRESL